MLNNGQIFTSTLYKNSNRLNSSKKQKINNIFTITNKGNNNYIDNQDSKLNKAIFTKIKNNVLLSNTYNYKKEYINKKNLRNFFFDNHINTNINNNNKEKQVLLKDNNYYKNNDFPNKNTLNQNITKSQRLFKLYMSKNKNEKRDIPNPKIYRYSTSNMHNNHNDNHNNNNNILVNKTSNLINKDRLIKSEKQDLFNNKENNIHIVKHFKKLLKYHKTNYSLKKNNSRENIEKTIRKPKFLIKNNSPINDKGKNELNKTNLTKKRPFSTRYNLNIPNNINSLDDLLELNSKNQNNDNTNNNLTNQLTKYILGKNIGKGAYAIVRVVINKLTNEKYAAKIYNKSEIKDKIKKRCVNNEIEILKRVNHKNIIKLIEVIELKDHILIIQELFIGISLSQYYKKNWKTEDLSKEKEKKYKIILKQIFEGINYLHKNNIAHLDIKLDNILINKKLEIRIIDFGFGIYDPKKTLNNFFGGTPNYMSPEIVLKRPYISIYSDIWSLGVLVFKLFCNEYPFKGFTERDLYTAIKKGKYRIKCYVHYDIKKIINSMLILDPNKRLSCEQLLNNPWFYNN